MSTPLDDSKVSEFPDANPLTGAEYIEVIQDGVNRKTTISALAGFVTPPLAAPASLTATAGDGEVDLVWEAVVNATGYTLERATLANYSNAGVIFTGAALTYTDATAVNGTHYYYRVRATAPGYASSGYALDDATPQAAMSPLATPVITLAVISTSQINVSWLAVPNRTSYLLQRATNAGFTTGLTTLYTGTGLSFNDTGLTPATQYFYRLRAVGDDVSYTDSAYDTDDATTTALITLATPELTLAVISSSQINASWLAVPNRTSYLLQRATDAGFTANLTTVYSSTGLSFNNTGLTASTQYFYRLKAVGDGITYGDSAYDTDNATTQGVATFTADWGWTPTDPYVDDSTIPTIGSYQGTGNFNQGALISADFHTMPTQNFAIVKEPSTEPVKTIWDDVETLFNNGTIPDSIFRAGFVVSGFRYYVSRVALDFDTGVSSRVEFS